MADDVGEVDDESLLLLSIAGALAAAAVAASRERGTFIRIHFGTDFAFSFDALFIETFYLRLPNRICFLLSQLSLIGTGFGVMLVLHSTFASFRSSCFFSLC